ncbi:MAG TPA: bifunctional homocysteine S-methyltransferase/methylenetetrahydrofolate reductase [Chloroflexota bacterium]|nr:bifunctional homocysteine S-methyltransferase/methylenetetrahydrofolate reductase [Chloroflexota bacterium]
MARIPFRDRLQRAPLLADGALGTLLYERGVPYERGFDELNVTQPTLIERLHREYLAAGAELIESNTFGANRLRLAVYGQEARAAELNAKGVRLAAAARAEVAPQAYVAGAIGPVGQPLEPVGAIGLSDARAAFAAQAAALAEAGADVLLLETFSDLRELREAIIAARAVCDLPLVAQMSFTADGRTPTGESPEEVARTLEALGVDVLGVNCGVGPQVALDVLGGMAAVARTPLVAQPNAGFPGRVGGRIFYLSTPQYLADYAKRFVAAGARLIGGCCGTTPEHTRAMSAALATERARPRVVVPAPPTPSRASGALAARPEPTPLQRRLASGPFVLAAELEPPAGQSLADLLATADALVAAGVDCVNVPDPPSPRGRLSSLALAVHLRAQRTLDVLLHCTTRDRNLLALQADLLGAHALGIRDVLATTGDPLRIGTYPHAAGVWDVDAAGLIEILARMNRGEDWAGSPLAEPTAFHVGCTVAVTGDPAAAREQLQRKLEAGAQFVLAPPLFAVDQLDALLRDLGPLAVPLVVGVLPLESSRHAEFLHNEVPGMLVPDAVRDRLRRAGTRAAAEGRRLAAALLAAAHERVAGAYLVPPNGRAESLVELLRQAGVASAETQSS